MIEWYMFIVYNCIGSLLIWKRERERITLCTPQIKNAKRVQLTPRIMENYRITVCLQIECKVLVMEVQCIREEITVTEQTLQLQESITP